MSSPLYIGVLSGTSMDGIDCALLDFSGTTPHLLDFICDELPAALKQQLLTLCANRQGDLQLLGSTDIAVAMSFARTVDNLLARNNLHARDVAAIGSHGQTIWHEPPQTARGHPFTLQIGDPNTLAELAGITVVADFRRRDMAAGGQGAPIVPALHRELFSSQTANRIILNLGGIANITFLPRLGAPPCGFDTGPASVLMDLWIGKYQGHAFDEGGQWAASGQINGQLLSILLDEPYFSAPPPKSTGRELFNANWLERKLEQAALVLRPEDVQATLLELTATTISRQIMQLARDGDIAVCGGGARNAVLMATLAGRLPAFRLMTTTALGLDADAVEATAFAWLARKALAGAVVDLAPFTGARHAVIAGGIYKAGPQR